MLAHLIAEAMDQEPALSAPSADPDARRAAFVAAVRAALRQVEGAYAVAAVSPEAPGLIVAARKFSPLVVGVGDGESLLASDIPALLPYTRQVVLLEDSEPGSASSGRRAPLACGRHAGDPRPDHDRLERRGGGEGRLPPLRAQGDRRTAPGARRHAARAHRRRRRPSAGHRCARPDGHPARDAHRVRHVGLRRPRRRAPAVALGGAAGRRRDRVRVPLRRSDRRAGHAGRRHHAERRDGRHAGRAAPRQDAGAPTLALCNVVGSSVTRLADATLFLQVGPEIGVVATKTFTAQLALLTLLSVSVAARVGHNAGGRSGDPGRHLAAVPSTAIQAALAYEPDVAAIVDALDLVHTLLMFFIGHRLRLSRSRSRR
ncbi:MAG: SIS domain-containing protein [Anaerolineae bacterium]